MLFFWEGRKVKSYKIKGALIKNILLLLIYQKLSATANTEQSFRMINRIVLITIRKV
jgi:hypothetical protein